MRSIVRRAVFPLSALLCFATVGAFPGEASALETQSPRVVARGGVPWLYVSRVSQATQLTQRSLTGRSKVAPLPVRDLEARARRQVASTSPAAASVAADLVVTKAEALDGGETIVRFSQVHRGLPVISRGATVRLAAGGEPLITAVDLETDLPTSVEPQLTGKQAESEALRVATAIGAGVLQALHSQGSSASSSSPSGKDAHLVVWPTAGGGTRLAYVVLPRIPAGLPTAPRIVVDANTGEILEARDLVRFAHGQVYRQNPVTTPDTSLEELALPPEETLAGPLLISHNCVDKKRVTPIDMFGFKANVHVCDLETAAPNEDGNYVFTPDDTPGSAESKSDTFAEVSMYYHAAKAYAFFRGLGGVADAQVVEDKPLRVVANLQLASGLQQGNLAAASDPNKPLDPFSNAFFSPAQGGLGDIFGSIYGISGGGLWFGQGPQRDYAYDGDVVYHEFTHAVVDATLKLGAWHLDNRGAIDAPGAMNEGLADYFSSAITGDPNVGEYASKDLSNAEVIRTLANTDACPTNVIGEVHADSTLFPGALWEARVAIAESDRSAFDAALYKAMRTHAGRGDLGYGDLATLFIETLAIDLPAGATALETAMKKRGVLPSCERILTFDGAAVHARDKSIGGFSSPGTATVGVSGVAPGVVQVHAKLTPGSPTLTVSFSVREGGGGGGIGGQATPFAPTVLAKFGQPITWTYAKGKPSHDADLKIATDGGSTRSADIAIPEGATDIYVQIANTGQSDGTYDGIDFAFTPAETASPADPSTTTGAPDTAATPSTDDGGCGCSVPGTNSSRMLPVSAFSACAALVVALVRRRRKA